MESNPPCLNLDISEGQQRLSDEKLELRLGPPTKEEDQSVLSSAQNRKFGHGNHVRFSEMQGGKLFQTPFCSGSLPNSASWSEKAVNNVLKFQHPGSSASWLMQHAGNTTGHPPPSGDNTTISSCSQKRPAPPSVIGWPPVRSFRKKFTASFSSLKLSPEDEKGGSEMVKDLFVKINMDGVPIGRKVDLRAYDNYDALSSAVDQLFRGLLGAQRDCSVSTGGEIKLEEPKEITGLLDGKGEYTLVYEDHEGDRVLVSDVPWNMFLSTVKRLRVLKTSELGAK